MNRSPPLLNARELINRLISGLDHLQATLFRIDPPFPDSVFRTLLVGASSTPDRIRLTEAVLPNLALPTAVNATDLPRLDLAWIRIENFETVIGVDPITRFGQLDMQAYLAGWTAVSKTVASYPAHMPTSNTTGEPRSPDRGVLLQRFPTGIGQKVGVLFGCFLVPAHQSWISHNS
jgi:hypothetical protein